MNSFTQHQINVEKERQRVVRALESIEQDIKKYGLGLQRCWRRQKVREELQYIESTRQLVQEAFEVECLQKSRQPVNAYRAM